jgi:CheY-like chemotaxis protein
MEFAMARQINALIVEDSTATRKLIIGALKHAGLAEFTFTEAMDGVDALAKFQPGKTQLLLVDMNMPRLGGLDLIRELHKRHPACPPAVVITGETGTERIKEALNEPGVAAFLLKPVDRDRLRTGLKTLVDSIPESEGPCPVPHGECVPLALQEVLAKGCGLQLTAVPADAALRHGDVVLGLISIFGDVHWSVGLGFGRSAAQRIAARFAGSGTPLDGADTGDAIGELTNIVGGRIKLLLSAREVAVKSSFPTVISASGLQLLTQRRLRDAVAYAHFECPDGKLWTGVTLGLAGGIFL